MLSQSAPTTAASDAEALTPNARQLLAYLDEEVTEETYLNSRFIAREIDLSAKEVGSMLAKLQDEPVGVTIEKWGYTNGTTWRIRPEEENGNQSSAVTSTDSSSV